MGFLRKRNALDRILVHSFEISSGENMSFYQLTSPLILDRDPIDPMEAATKQYVDNIFENLDAGNFTSGTIPYSLIPNLTGVVSYTTGNNSISLTNSGVTAGTYPAIKVENGRVTEGRALQASDVPNVSWTKITSGKPTTLAGYGITDAIGLSGGTITGNISLTASPSDDLHMVTKGYVDSLLVGQSGGIKTGDIIRTTSSITPEGFLKCNGGGVSKTTYSALYSVIGDDFTSTYLPGLGNPYNNHIGIEDLFSGSVEVTWKNHNIQKWTKYMIRVKNKLLFFGDNKDYQNGQNVPATQWFVYHSDINDSTNTVSVPVLGKTYNRNTISQMDYTSIILNDTLYYPTSQTNIPGIYKLAINNDGSITTDPVMLVSTSVLGYQIKYMFALNNTTIYAFYSSGTNLIGIIKIIITTDNNYVSSTVIDKVFSIPADFKAFVVHKNKLMCITHTGYGLASYIFSIVNNEINFNNYIYKEMTMDLSIPLPDNYKNFTVGSIFYSNNNLYVLGSQYVDVSYNRDLLLYKFTIDDKYDIIQSSSIRLNTISSYANGPYSSTQIGNYLAIIAPVYTVVDNGGGYPLTTTYYTLSSLMIRLINWNTDVYQYVNNTYISDNTVFFVPELEFNKKYFEKDIYYYIKY